MCAANTTVGPPPVPLRTPLTLEHVVGPDVAQPELLHFGADVCRARLLLCRTAPESPSSLIHSSTMRGRPLVDRLQRRPYVGPLEQRRLKPDALRRGGRHGEQPDDDGGFQHADSILGST